MNFDIKFNINKIDSDLKTLFENVYISEGSEKGNFFVRIVANKMFLFEGCKKRVEVHAKIDKSELNNSVIKWSYSINPLNEAAGKIERVSNITTIASDIYDIASNKRMVNEYFNSLESHVDLITEETGTMMLPGTIQNITKIISKYGNIMSTISNEISINFTLFEEINMPNMFRIERELIDNGTKFVSFDYKTIKVTF